MYIVNFVGSSFHSPLVRYILSPLNGESIVSKPDGDMNIKDGGFAVSALGIPVPNIFSQSPVEAILQTLLILIQPLTL